MHKFSYIISPFPSVKPFPPGAFSLSSPPKSSTPPPTPAPAWLGRSIATHKLRLLEYSAFVDEQRLVHDSNTYHKHLFVHFGGLLRFQIRGDIGQFCFAYLTSYIL